MRVLWGDTLVQDIRPSVSTVVYEWFGVQYSTCPTDTSQLLHAHCVPAEMCKMKQSRAGLEPARAPTAPAFKVVSVFNARDLSSRLQRRREAGRESREGACCYP